MKTFNRGKLKKLAAAGKLLLAESYHFDDMMGEHRNKDAAIPVRIKAGYGDFIEGYCNLFESDFSGKSGRAWENADGTITLIVHSNANYTFKVKENHD